MLDHIIVTPGMLDDRLSLEGSQQPAVEFPELFFHSEREGAIDSPSKSYSKNDFHKDGYSDHLPASCVIANKGRRSLGS